MNNSSKNHSLPAIVLIATLLFAIILSVSFLYRYRRDSIELKSLTRQINETTERWRQIDADKMLLKNELNALNNQILDAEDDIASAEKRQNDIDSLREEIKSLEEQLAALSPASSAE
jgi:peptidoglycan hydrolase CwlO-like protein